MIGRFSQEKLEGRKIMFWYLHCDIGLDVLGQVCPRVTQPRLRQAADEDSLKGCSKVITTRGLCPSITREFSKQLSGARRLLPLITPFCNVHLEKVVTLGTTVCSLRCCEC